MHNELSNLIKEVEKLGTYHENYEIKTQHDLYFLKKAPLVENITFPYSIDRIKGYLITKIDNTCCKLLDYEKIKKFEYFKPNQIHINLKNADSLYNLNLDLRFLNYEWIKENDNKRLRFKRFIVNNFGCYNEGTLNYTDNKREIIIKKIKNQIDKIIDVRDNTLKIIIFPENMLPNCDSFIDELARLTTENPHIIIIGGLEHLSVGENYVNSSVLLINGVKYYCIKATPFISLRKDIREKIKCDINPDLKIFKVGNISLSIFICRDFLRFSEIIFDWATKNFVNLIIILAFTTTILPFVYRILSIFSEYKDPPFKIVFCNVAEFGGSNVFFKERQNQIEEEYQKMYKGEKSESVLRFDLN